MDAAAGGVEIALLPWPELVPEDVAEGAEPVEPELAEAIDDDAERKEEKEELRLARLRELIKREAGAWVEAAAKVRQPWLRHAAAVDSRPRILARPAGLHLEHVTFPIRGTAHRALVVSVH